MARGAFCTDHIALPMNLGGESEFQQFMNRTLTIWLGSLAIVGSTLILAVGLGFYKYSEIQRAMRAPPPPETPISVVVAIAGETEFQLSTSVIGTVLAPRSITLSNEVAGTVSSMAFDPGQIVEEGQLLVELDSSVERAQLDSAVARLRMAESSYKRIQEAAAVRAITTSEVEEAEALLAQAEAAVKELAAVIQRKTLSAPFRGRIGLSDTHVGQFLPSGFEIVTLQSIDDFVFVDFMIPQVAAESIRVGQSVALLVANRQLSGEIIALDAQANRQTRNLMARAKLESALEILRPGESVTVSINYGPLQTTATVPVEALRQAPMQSFVYVVQMDAEGAARAHERIVQVGPTLGGQLCLLAGIEPGQQVVADGSFKLRDGALIQPTDKFAEDTAATEVK